MFNWDLIEICWIYIFFCTIVVVVECCVRDDAVFGWWWEKLKGSLEFQSRFTRPLKPFFHHSHGPQHAPSGSTRGVFLCIYFIQQGFLFLIKSQTQLFIRHLLIRNWFPLFLILLNQKCVLKALDILAHFGVIVWLIQNISEIITK